MNIISVCLWADSNKQLPAYSSNKYSLQDLAKLRALIYKVLEPSKVPYKFLAFVDDYFYNAIITAQREILDTPSGLWQPSADAYSDQAKETEDGPPYVKVEPSYVHWLEDVIPIKFTGEDCGGWSRRFECFMYPPKEGFRGLMLDLDTIPLKDFSWLFRWDVSPVGLALDPFAKTTVCSTVVTYDKAGCDIIYNRYLQEKETGMRAYKMAGSASEMQLLRALWKEHNWRPLEREPSKLLSYKAHVMKNYPIHSADIVYFHGKPKPNDLAVESYLGKIWAEA
jgi:hypothetical protein